jgi:hypothetical protein
VHGEEVYKAIATHNLPLLSSEGLERTEITLASQGIGHAFADKKGQRIKWTPFELNFVGTWCQAMVDDNPDCNYKVVRMCLDHIRSRSELLAHFHSKHTVDRSRLAFAWNTWKKGNSFI